MKVPTYDKLLNPTLTALHHLGGSASIAELRDQVIEDLKLPKEIVEQPHPGKSNRTELEYRLAWARTYLKKYGAITNSARAVWALTPKGNDLETVRPQDVVRFVREQSRRERAGRTELGETDDIQAAPEIAEETVSWRETLTATLLDMPPDAFERLCQRVLRESGFIQVEVTGVRATEVSTVTGCCVWVACLASP